MRPGFGVGGVGVRPVVEEAGACVNPPGLFLISPEMVVATSGGGGRDLRVFTLTFLVTPPLYRCHFLQRTCSSRLGSTVPTSRVLKFSLS